jgi:LPS O-antigen subunit length determinant protein (WzzB/FepE family)
MSIPIELFIAILSLIVAAFSVFYAIRVNKQTAQTLELIKRESASANESYNEYVKSIIESNPQLVAASAKKDFMKFLQDNPDLIKALTIRPGGMIILASIFESKYSEADFRRLTENLYSMTPDSDEENNISIKLTGETSPVNPEQGCKK